MSKNTAPPAPPPVQAAIAAAREAAALAAEGGIGTLTERTLHRALKFWLDPDEQHHEVPLAGFVADIFDGQAVTEVQTGGLFSLQKKLAALLREAPVTVVVPLPRERWVGWVDPETGECGTLRRSPRRGRVTDILPELGWVYSFWDTKTYPYPFVVRLLLVDVEELRLRDGRGPDGKKGAHRMDRLPLAVTEERWLRSLSDAVALAPPLPQPFTRADFAKALGKRGAAMSRALRFLEQGGAVTRVGKQGNVILFKKEECLSRLQI